MRYASSRHDPELLAAARHFGRRRFFTVTAAVAALAFTTNLPAWGAAGSAELDAARIAADPFTLGIASGDPLPGSVLLWTRLAPAPYEPDGGLPQQYVVVEWEVAGDELFSLIVRSGTAVAHPEYHHSVHVDVDGLEPGRVYYYRFRTGAWISETGRTRTAPATTATTAATATLSYADNDPPEMMLLRRAAAYRAHWGNQPLRDAQLPNGPDTRLYRRLQWGTLAQFDVLDTRQYRSDQAYGDTQHIPGPESDDPARTITGAAQESWLIDGWRASGALWNVMPQQVCFSQRRLDLNPAARMSMDAWDGYRASRRRILDGAKSAGVENLVVMTGDVHVGYAFDIKDDFDDPASRTLGTELVATSVASGRDGAEKPPTWDTYLRANPHLKFYNGLRGYVKVTLDRQAARADFRTVSAVTTPGAPITTTASFLTEAGNPGLEPA